MLEPEPEPEPTRVHPPLQSMCERTLMQIMAMRSHGKPRRISSVDSVASLCFEMGVG